MQGELRDCPEEFLKGDIGKFSENLFPAERDDRKRSNNRDEVLTNDPARGMTEAEFKSKIKELGTMVGVTPPAKDIGTRAQEGPDPAGANDSSSLVAESQSATSQSGVMPVDLEDDATVDEPGSGGSLYSRAKDVSIRPTGTAEVKYPWQA